MNHKEEKDNVEEDNNKPSLLHNMTTMFRKPFTEIGINTSA